MTESEAQRGTNWSREEVEATVADYLAMLTLELSGQAYSKSEHRRPLSPKLRGRSDSAIERKHQNISAVLIELGYPPITGYKPLGNYQRLLFEVVAERLAKTPSVDAAAAAAVEQPAAPLIYPDFAAVEVEAPSRSAAEPKLREAATDSGNDWTLRLVQRDYLQREARNRSLGEAGELFVVDLERWRLRQAGRNGLAEKVLHVSREKGDGAGFDILSYQADGKERFIEVKTTSFSRETPFFVSQREVEVSEREAAKFAVYRLFDFRHRPQMFELPGRIADHCHLNAQSYRASFS